MNEFYFQLMRDALPESALDPSQQQTQQQQVTSKDSSVENGSADSATAASVAPASDARHMNGSLRRCRFKTDHNGHTHNSVEHAQLQAKLEKLEKHLAQQTANREREKANSSQAQTVSSTPAQSSSNSSSSSTSPHGLSNGVACHAVHEDDDKHDQSKGGVKSSRCEKKEASTIKEEKRKNKSRDKDKESDSHKSTEHTKEQIVKDKEVESTKDSIKIKEWSNKDVKEKEREKERETRDREREREREMREARECAEELKRVRIELAAARSSEAEAKRALAAAAAAERQRRADHHQLKQAHASLQHKVSAWRTGERATLERRLADERRARAAAEGQLLRARHARPPSGECESESCRSRRTAAEADAAALRRELTRTRDRAAQLQRDLTLASDQYSAQVRSMEAKQELAAAEELGPPGSTETPTERCRRIEASLQSETRVKLDLLSALGEAKRKLHIQEGLLFRQEKEIEELKAQMLAVMPPEFVSPVNSLAALRRGDGSPLDPNACVYTPKLAPCGDA